MLIHSYLAGGCAGAASRTVVSPLERLKIIQSVYFSHHIGSADHIWLAADKCNPVEAIRSIRVYIAACFACGRRRDSKGS